MSIIKGGCQNKLFAGAPCSTPVLILNLPLAYTMHIFSYIIPDRLISNSQGIDVAQKNN
jgi:hypothetical protein